MVKASTPPPLSPPSHAGLGGTTMFCVPPPRPFDTDTSHQGMKWDGPLVLNGLLVAAERYSALKRARFGSETSPEALRGMRMLLRLPADVARGAPGPRLVGQSEEDCLREETKFFLTLTLTTDPQPDPTVLLAPHSIPYVFFLTNLRMLIPGEEGVSRRST